MPWPDERQLKRAMTSKENSITRHETTFSRISEAKISTTHQSKKQEDEFKAEKNDRRNVLNREHKKSQGRGQPRTGAKRGTGQGP